MRKTPITKKLQAKLDEWSAEISKLKAKAEGAGADAELKYNDQIDELKSRQAAASQKLDELRSSSDDAWQDLKAGVENAWSNLEKSVRSAQSRFS